MQTAPANNRAKWMLVGVLGVVLVGVVVWQLLPSGDATAVNESRGAAPNVEGEAPADRLPRRFPAKGVSLTASPTTIATQWPTIPLAKIVAHDPFAPETLPGVAAGAAASESDAELAAQQERAAQLAETLEALRERGVNLVLHTADGPVATIGDRMIKVGDKVGDYRVTEIDADGVVLEPAPPK